MAESVLRVLTNRFLAFLVWIFKQDYQMYGLVGQTGTMMIYESKENNVKILYGSLSYSLVHNTFLARHLILGLCIIFKGPL